MQNSLVWVTKIYDVTNMAKKQLVGKEIYFDAQHFGYNGRLRGKIIKDGDVSGEYKNHILLRGVYTDRDVWLTKSVLKDRITKFVKPISYKNL